MIGIGGQIFILLKVDDGTDLNLFQLSVLSPVRLFLFHHPGSKRASLGTVTYLAMRASLSIFVIITI